MQRQQYQIAGLGRNQTKTLLGIETEIDAEEIDISPAAIKLKPY